MTDYEALAKRLRELAETDEAVEIFNKREVEAIRRMIRAVDMLESWGKLGKGALWLLTGIAGALIAWEQIATWLTSR